jgi:hypothetical protein
MKEFLKRNLPLGLIKKISRAQFFLKGFLYRKNLNQLAKLHNCDKWGNHFYTQHYMSHFNNIRKNDLILFEIGVGGYNNPLKGGASLRMWKDYFRNATINAIDIFDKSHLQEKRIRIFKGDQTDDSFLKSVIKEIGCPDIIIDDGSHVNEHIIASFKHLFPYLKNGGWYVVEDLQTSYWKSFGGNSENLNDPSTAINFFKSLVHGLNHKEFMIENYVPSYTELNITEVHFYHNLVFIRKDLNDESSSYLINNKVP